MHISIAWNHAVFFCVFLRFLAFFCCRWGDFSYLAGPFFSEHFLVFTACLEFLQFVEFRNFYSVSYFVVISACLDFLACFCFLVLTMSVGRVLFSCCLVFYRRKTQIWSCCGIRLGSVVAPTPELQKSVKAKQVGQWIALFFYKRFLSIFSVLYWFLSILLLLFSIALFSAADFYPLTRSHSMYRFPDLIDFSRFDMIVYLFWLSRFRGALTASPCTSSQKPCGTRTTSGNPNWSYLDLPYSRFVLSRVSLFLVVLVCYCLVFVSSLSRLIRSRLVLSCPTLSCFVL